MEKNNEVPPDPDNETNSNPEAPQGQFVVDTDGDPVGPDGNKLPRVFPDIPCRWCVQHTHCIQSEQCLGPASPNPAPKRPASSTIQKGLLTSGKGEPGAPHHKVGEPYIEGGGGIRRVRRNIGAALGTLTRTANHAELATDALTRAEAILAPALADSQQASAGEAVTAAQEALSNAEHASSLIIEGKLNLTNYGQSLYH